MTAPLCDPEHVWRDASSAVLVCLCCGLTTQTPHDPGRPQDEPMSAPDEPSPEQESPMSHDEKETAR